MGGFRALGGLGVLWFMYRSSLHIGCVVVPCVCVARFGAVVLNVCLSRVCVYLCVCVCVCCVFSEL